MTPEAGWTMVGSAAHIRHEVLYGSRVVRCFANRPANVDDLFRQAVALGFDAAAITDESRSVSYGELDLEVQALAGGLRGAGLKPGERVAFLLGNSIEAVLVLLACARTGLVAVPLGVRLTRSEITHICRDSGACALIHEDALAHLVPESGAAPDIALRWVVGMPGRGSLSFAELATNSVATADAPAGQAPLLLCYTSGTTGKPKGAIVTHLALVHSCMHWRLGLALPDRPTTIMAVPVAHIGGIAGVILPVLYVAGHVRMLREFKARRFLELAQDLRMDFCATVPTMLALMLLEPDFATFDLSAWKLALYSGAPMPPATERALARAVPHLTQCHAYGATETATAISMMPALNRGADARGVGLAAACADVVVMDDAGLELPTGEPGELWISGPMVSPGYWNNPQATNESFIGGYWRSGDVGRIGADGYIEILDRKKDMMVRGGFKVFAAEVEHALAECQGVLEAAVVGRPDPVLGERTVAFVCVSDALRARELRRFCADRLSNYKVPDFFVTSGEALPRNANGKVDKRQLRAAACNAELLESP